MLIFEFRNEDLNLTSEDVNDDDDCVAANIKMDWPGDCPVIGSMLDRFKYFLKACTFADSCVERIVFLSEEQYDLLNAKSLLSEGKDEV